MGFLDVWLMKVDLNGDSVWARTWGAGQADEASDVKVCFDGGYILAGSAFLAGTYDDAWLLKTEPDVGITENDAEHITNVTLSVTPNPFTHSTDIRYQITDDRQRTTKRNEHLRIYDTSGRLVRDFGQLSVIGHQLSVSWDGRDGQNRKVGSGVYLLEFKTEGHSLFEKLVLID
jgi:hypothetical protein